MPQQAAPAAVLGGASVGREATGYHSRHDSSLGMQSHAIMTAIAECRRTVLGYRLRRTHQLRCLGQPRPRLPQQGSRAEALRLVVSAAGPAPAAACCAAVGAAAGCCALLVGGRCCCRLYDGCVLQGVCLQRLLRGDGRGSGRRLFQSELR